MYTISQYKNLGEFLELAGGKFILPASKWSRHKNNGEKVIYFSYNLRAIPIGCKLFNLNYDTDIPDFVLNFANEYKKNVNSKSSIFIAYIPNDEVIKGYEQYKRAREK